MLKPFTHAFWPLGDPRGCYPNAAVNGFFFVYTYDIRTPHDSKRQKSPAWKDRPDPDSGSKGKTEKTNPAFNRASK